MQAKDLGAEEPTRWEQYEAARVKGTAGALNPVTLTPASLRAS